MSKMNYRVCDICGNILKTDIRFTGYVNGYRIWNKLFNRLDICNECLDKIKYLSIDKENEDEYIKEVFNNARHYDDIDLEIAYYQGMEDTLEVVLSHKRLANIKIK